MKFKFRADSEDLFIFIMFAIFLLYIVALCVANIHTFAAEGHLSGLNPLPAFRPEYIFSTIFLYLIANAIVGYNFAYAYAKYTDVKPNRFGYVIATLVVLASVISGIATYALGNTMANSIVGDMTKIDDDLDF